MIVRIRSIQKNWTEITYFPTAFLLVTKQFTYFIILCIQSICIAHSITWWRLMSDDWWLESMHIYCMHTHAAQNIHNKHSFLFSIECNSSLLMIFVNRIELFNCDCEDVRWHFSIQINRIQFVLMISIFDYSTLRCFVLTINSIEFVCLVDVMLNFGLRTGWCQLAMTSPPPSTNRTVRALSAFHHHIIWVVLFIKRKSRVPQLCTYMTYRDRTQDCCEHVSR